MALQSVLAYAAGKLARVLPLQASAGVASAGALVALNAAGLVDTTMVGLSGKSRIINGGMSVDQRNLAASQTITAGAALAYTIDRFYAYSTGANVTGQRVQGPALPQYQFTGAAGVTAIGFGHRVEALSSADLAGGNATLSVNLTNSLLTSVTWTAYYANSTDTFGTLASPNRTQIATGTFTVSSTLARYAATFAVPTAATTGIEIVFTVGPQTSGTWLISNVQFEAGTQATPFERRLAGEEIIRCQRYFQRWTQPPLRGGSAGGTTGSRLGMALPVAMRIAPIPTMNGNLPVIVPGVGGSTVSSIASNYSTASVIEFDMTLAASLGTAGQTMEVYQSGTSSLDLNAEL